MATKTGLPTTKKELLQSLIYRKKPRAFNEDTGMCTYDHQHNGGCGIGSAVSKHTAQKLQDCEQSIFLLIKDKIMPNRLSKMGECFLQRIQHIHDVRVNWVNHKTARLKNGLVWNDEGIKEINALIKEYNLNMPLIDKNSKN